MNLVVDASVALKWFFQTRNNESCVDRSLDVLSGLDSNRYKMVQPPHFLAEMAAVLAREKPEGVFEDMTDLQSMDWQLIEDPSIYEVAIELSIRLHHHLFDTLYHAAALSANATLVTSDSRYYNKAKDLGHICILDNFST